MEIITAKINLNYKKFIWNSKKGKFFNYVGIRKARQFLKTIPARKYHLNNYIKGRVLHINAEAKPGR